MSSWHFACSKIEIAEGGDLIHLPSFKQIYIIPAQQVGLANLACSATSDILRGDLDVHRHSRRDYSVRIVDISIDIIQLQTIC